jgi:hypothetical protein
MVFLVNHRLTTKQLGKRSVWCLLDQPGTGRHHRITELLSASILRARGTPILVLTTSIGVWLSTLCSTS